jgi:hypothetical protein
MSAFRPSKWLLRSQYEGNNPASFNKPAPLQLSLNKPVVFRNNSTKRIAYAPVKTAPKTGKGRKAQKARKTRKIRR